MIADNISERIRAGDITVLDPSLKSLDKWTLWQPSVSLSDAAALLEECLAVFNSRYANTSLEESEAAVTKEVCADMLSMQLQPMIMDEFRRYVVLTNVEDERFEKSNTAPYSEVRFTMVFTEISPEIWIISIPGLSGVPSSRLISETISPRGTVTRRLQIMMIVFKFVNV